MKSTLIRRISITLTALLMVAGLSVYSPAPASAASFGACVVTLGGDYSHISGTPPRAVQGHGWWKSSTGSCAGWRLRVRVLVQVETNILGYVIWGTINTGTYTWVKPGGGSGNRATGRYTCSNATSSNTFRTVVQGELQRSDGIWVAAPGAIVTATTVLKCG